MACCLVSHGSATARASRLLCSVSSIGECISETALLVVAVVVVVDELLESVKVSAKLPYRGGGGGAPASIASSGRFIRGRGLGKAFEGK